MADEYPPFLCDMHAEQFPDVEIFDPDGKYVNGLVASACAADYFCAYVFKPLGHTWRRRPPDPPPSEEPVNTDAPA
ncbi:hypothetical protein IP91_02571 [Pseudoduganella lurida]|uniref:Uncharacterized protein n=1 Tax=Pseudoduganella lurida TaxID=1036180 RepID=A0A562R9B0_9BURK|nr:hypothetical protein [Pseudoduganella lurida]TWI65164.1 hypothetical protein IP91_02571 [Pseudoduganella lurida]